MQYQINLDTEECVVNDLTDKFQPVQIPLNATFISEFYLGSSSANDTGVLVEAWTGTTTNPNGTPNTPTCSGSKYVMFSCTMLWDQYK